MDQNQQQSSGDTWVCMGACQAVVTDEEYKKGLTSCGAASCDMKGHPLVKGHKSEVTGKNVKSDSEELPAGTS